MDVIFPMKNSEKDSAKSLADTWACYRYVCKQNAFDGAIKLECLRTTEPLFRTYEPSDYRTFRTESIIKLKRQFFRTDPRIEPKFGTQVRIDTITLIG